MSTGNLFSPPPKFNGNKTLVDHGIHTEDSDYRAHVVYPEYVYVFPTKPAMRVAFEYPKRRASVPGSGIPLQREEWSP